MSRVRAFQEGAGGVRPQHHRAWRHRHERADRGRRAAGGGRDHRDGARARRRPAPATSARRAARTARRPAATPRRRSRDRHGRRAATRDHLRTARARQREEYGGINWGAAFFGWLVAVGLGSLLVAILAAAGAAVGLTENVTETDATSNAETIGLGGAIALLVVLMIAYYSGGYVAGRMSRFDGARQGFGAWLFGIAVTIVLALAAVILGSEYNVLDQLNLPALPVGDADADDRRRDRARRRRARHPAGRRRRRQGGRALPPQGGPRRVHRLTGTNLTRRCLLSGAGG